MARKVELYRAKDGKMFENKVAANVYERGLIVSEKIDQLPIPASAQEYMKKNFEEIRKIVDSSGGTQGYIEPGMDVPDIRAPRKAILNKGKKKTKRKSRSKKKK